MKVNPIQHTDVRGKILYYVEFKNDYGKSTLINVGRGTYENVQQLIVEELTTEGIEMKLEELMTEETETKPEVKQKNKTK